MLLWNSFFWLKMSNSVPSVDSWFCNLNLFALGFISFRFISIVTIGCWCALIIIEVMLLCLILSLALVHQPLKKYKNFTTNTTLKILVLSFLMFGSSSMFHPFPLRKTPLTAGYLSANSPSCTFASRLSIIF